MNILYLILNIVLAVSCLWALYRGWHKGMVYMAVRLILWVLSFYIAWICAQPLSGLIDLSAWLKPVFQNVQVDWLSPVMWFFIIFALEQGLFEGIAYSFRPKGHGLFSLANRVGGLIISAVIMALDILMLVSILEMNLFGFGQDFLAHSWLQPASVLIHEKMEQVMDYAGQS